MGESPWHCADVVVLGRWHLSCIGERRLEETKMRATTDIGTLSLGDIVAASCELGSTVARDSDGAMDLAARHLGRLLARSKNAKLVVALTAMAQEFAPAARVRPTTSRRSIRRAA